MLAIDPTDKIVQALAVGADAEFINTWRGLKSRTRNVPVIFRSMTQRKTVQVCEKQQRDYFYIDTGYIGNLGKTKRWHRVVKNGMQHSQPRFDLPSDRFDEICERADSPHIKFDGWQEEGSAILLVTPSEKPCKFYGVDRGQWVENTIATLREHTDREIIVRDKAERRGDRVRDNSIFKQFVEDDIYAVVTYNSIAAIEAISFGIPAFTMAPTAADLLCLKDVQMIESPLRDDLEKVASWQNWLGYCQYSTAELTNGTALKLQQELNLL
jgi:hypothetical protein